MHYDFDTGTKSWWDGRLAFGLLPGLQQAGRRTVRQRRAFQLAGPSSTPSLQGDYPMTYLQAIVIGLIQGATELFPVSSLGHAVLVPSILHWNLNVGEPFFLSFLVATHFATATVLFVMFWDDWKRIFAGLGRSVAHGGVQRHDAAARLGVLLGDAQEQRRHRMGPWGLRALRTSSSRRYWLIQMRGNLEQRCGASTNGSA
jgi:Bacitracin resistance protein BacA